MLGIWAPTSACTCGRLPLPVPALYFLKACSAISFYSTIKPFFKAIGLLSRWAVVSFCLGFMRSLPAEDLPGRLLFAFCSATVQHHSGSIPSDVPFVWTGKILSLTGPCALVPTIIHSTMLVFELPVLLLSGALSFHYSWYGRCGCSVTAGRTTVSRWFTLARGVQFPALRGVLLRLPRRLRTGVAGVAHTWFCRAIL